MLLQFWVAPAPFAHGWILLGPAPCRATHDRCHLWRRKTCRSDATSGCHAQCNECRVNTLSGNDEQTSSVHNAQQPLMMNTNHEMLSAIDGWQRFLTTRIVTKQQLIPGNWLCGLIRVASVSQFMRLPPNIDKLITRGLAWQLLKWWPNSLTTSTGMVIYPIFRWFGVHLPNVWYVWKRLMPKWIFQFKHQPKIESFTTKTNDLVVYCHFRRHPHCLLHDYNMRTHQAK